MDLVERFINYTKFDTQSSEESTSVPSTAKQLEFAKYLKKELEDEGLSDVEMDDMGYIYATLKSNTKKKTPTFPDQQDVQILAATKHGVKPVQNRLEAENSKGKLVYVGSNPFFYVDKLNNSIPYLVPRASVLLQDIGRAYFDSLQIKGIPLHKIIVTSILRTKDDVAKLRTRNGNATENSCHLYGTTFDICYNRYKQIQTREQPRRQVQNDTLKWVFSEVLRDFRNKNRCYIKYEVKQGCFHITVK